ncbi:MAG TPA: hypothetical protein VFH51_04890, partial [Myxococcota bacterium]|nr:hypothetical protein [Myxococcota bacterium]
WRHDDGTIGASAEDGDTIVPLYQPQCGESLEAFIVALAAAVAKPPVPAPPSLPDAARDAIEAMRDGGLEDDADALERALNAARP